MLLSGIVINMRIPTYRAWQATPGLMLQPSRVGRPPQTVQTVYTIGTEVEVTTDQGQWHFGIDQEMTFPRRWHNEVKNWPTIFKEHGSIPTPMDIAIGDKLRNSDEHPGEDAPAYDLIAWEARYQIVLDAYVESGTRSAFVKTVTQPDGTIRIWRFDIQESMVFPRIEQKRRKREIDRLRATYGPYRLIDNPDVTYEFYVHPYGYGRWPGGIAPFFVAEDPGHYKCRPPIQRGRWRKIEFAGEDRSDRHPNDPFG